MPVDERDEHWMRRAIAIARNGAGMVAPNPMVGAVLVKEDRILAEGWHRRLGGPHAEVECLRAFGDGPIPGDATMYVNLEPCSHHGRTPPCAELLIERGVKRLVVAHTDPNPEVNGRGIKRLLNAGVDVIVGTADAEARWLNRRFLAYHQHGRPYVILKWARSADGFIDDHGRATRISSPDTDVLVHRWRSEEAAVLVGSRTVRNDDPQLTVRHVQGRQPLRVVIDRMGTVSASSRIFDDNAPSLLLTSIPRQGLNVEQSLIGESGDPITALFDALRKRQITSVLVEGGAILFAVFIRSGLWDEARVITGHAALGGGTVAPAIHGVPVRSFDHGSDRIELFANGTPPDPAWAW